MTQASERIEQQAAQWLMHIDSKGTPERWEALDTWLTSNPRHRAAFLRLSVSWRSMDRFRTLRTLDDEVNENLVNARAVRRWNAKEPAVKERPRWSFGLQPAAAALALIALGVTAHWGSQYFKGQMYSTELGQHKHIELADGSTVDLNTSSRLRVRFSAQRRELALLQGEAAFTVAHNPARPFDVQAGARTFRALGTAFSVRLFNAEHVEAHVTEGRVAIDPPFTQVLMPGDIATIESRHLAVKKVPVAILTRKLTWTQGRLFFNGETLAQAVDEINRYNRRRLVIVDPKIAAAQISGTFEATDPDTFVKTLDKPFGIQALPPAAGAGSEVIRLDGKDPQ